MRIFAAVAALAGLALAGVAGAQQPSATGKPAPTVRQNVPDRPAEIPAVSNERAMQALANLEALRQGRLFVSDLSPQAMQDVLDLDRMLRGEGTDNRSYVQQCIDAEVSRAGGRPTRLAWEVIRLKCR